MIDRSNKSGGLSRVLELVRASASARTGNAAGRQGTDPRTNETSQAPRDPAVLRAQLRRQLAGIEAAPDKYAGAARRVVLREILAWEFGDAIRNHPEFLPMLDAVDAAIAANENVREKVAMLVQEFGAGGKE